MSDNLRGKSILLVDDDTDFLNILSRRCESIGLEVRTAKNLLTAMVLVDDQVPDLLCIDVEMPSGNGLSFCKMLMENPETAGISIMVVTGRRDAETLYDCQWLGASFIPKAADTWSLLESHIRNLMFLPDQSGKSQTTISHGLGAFQPESDNPNTSGSQLSVNVVEDDRKPADPIMDTIFEMLGDDPNLLNADSEPSQAKGKAEKELPWVLCIDDDADFSEVVKVRLESLGVAVVRAFDGREGYRKAFMHPASAILLDYEMPNGQGDYVLRRLNENPVTADIPVIVLTGVKDKMVERKMLNLGASAYLTKPVQSCVIREALAKHIDILEDSDEQVVLG